MSISISEYVLMATQAYYYYRSESSQSQTLAQAGFPGWTQVGTGRDLDLQTGFSASTFTNGDQYVVAFRGTDDWRAGQGDAEYNPTFAPEPANGGVGSQTRNAIQYVENLLKITPGLTLDKISFTGHSLGGGLAGIAGGYFNRRAVTFDPALYTNEIKDVAVRLEVLARYQYLGTNLDGFDEDIVTFRRLFSEFDPGTYIGNGTDVRETLFERFSRNVTNNVEVFRVQGEILDRLQLTPSVEDYRVRSENYTRIDIGDSVGQNRFLTALIQSLYLSSQTDPVTGEDPTSTEMRRLHHISTIVLAVLGYENRPGVAEVYKTLQQQEGLLSRLINEELTAINSLEGDNEERLDYKRPSHGNFERILNLNVSFANDFGESFRKTDDSTGGVESVGDVSQNGISTGGRTIGSRSGGGQNNVGSSLLSSSVIAGLRDDIIDLGFILARKVADRLNQVDPARVNAASYDKETTLLGSIVGDPSLFGPDAHSVAIQFRALTTEDEEAHDLTAEQKARLNQSLDNVYAGLFQTLGSYSKLDELYIKARKPGTDATLVFGSIANGGSNVRLASGFGIFLGGDDRDLFFASDDNKDDFFYGGDGNDALYGFKGDDFFDGGDGNDWIEGGDGKDEIYGGDGADRLTPGKGVDQVYGGSGDDLIIAEIGDGDDTLDGGFNNLPSFGHADGTDTVVYKYFHGDATIDLLDASEFFSRDMADFGLRISEHARGAGGESGGFGSDSLSSIERAAVEAGDGVDTLKITEDSQSDYILYIDLGGQPENKRDIIDLRTLTLGAIVDLAQDLVSWKAPGFTYSVTGATDDYTLTVRNAEAVLGGSGDDELISGGAAASRQILLDGGLSNDTVTLRGGTGGITAGGLGVTVTVHLTL